MDLKFRDSSGREIQMPPVSETIKAGDTMILDSIRMILQLCRGDGRMLPRYYITRLPLLTEKDILLLAEAFRQASGLAIEEVEGVVPFREFRFS